MIFKLLDDKNNEDNLDTIPNINELNKINNNNKNYLPLNNTSFSNKIKSNYIMKIIFSYLKEKNKLGY